jgi:hypothetical protein
MTDEQYVSATKEYNAEVDRRNKTATKSKKITNVLPMFIEEEQTTTQQRKIKEKERALKGREDAKKYIQPFTLSGEVKGKTADAKNWRPFTRSYTVVGI